LNYTRVGILDFRFGIADCKPRTITARKSRRRSFCNLDWLGSEFPLFDLHRTTSRSRLNVEASLRRCHLRPDMDS